MFSDDKLNEYNEGIELAKRYYTKTGKSPFLFNLKTGVVLSIAKYFSYSGYWRFITDEYYPVYDEENNYLSWYPYGFEDKKFENEMRKLE